jgi:hypothetical protein
VLTLSHWPQSPTPPALARDLSAAEIVLRLPPDASHRADLVLAPARGRNERTRCGRRSSPRALAEAVTNDHFDEDGLDVGVRHDRSRSSASRNAELLARRRHPAATSAS